MITAVMNDRDCVTAFGLWQWDYGQILRIQGLSLPPVVEIHFSLQPTAGETTDRIGVTKDGVTDVPIPDVMLEADTECIFAFIYLNDETSGSTVKKIRMPVKRRPKPGGVTPSDPVQENVFREAVAAVNESAGRAEKAETSAEAWTHGHADYPERAEDNAMYYAEKAKETAKEIETSKTDLDAAISGGRKVTEDAKAEAEKLQDAISDSQTERDLVENTILQAGEADQTLSGTIRSAESSINQAEETKRKLDESAVSADELKAALNNATEEVAKDVTVEQVVELIRQSLEFLSVMAETAGQAGSLNGFTLNLGADGAVILSYTDPETGELAGSTTFPRETTLRAISNTMTEINSSLCIIAKKNGGINEA